MIDTALKSLFFANTSIGNVARDRKAIMTLTESGWRVLVIGNAHCADLKGRPKKR